MLKHVFRIKPETKELRNKLKEIQSGNEELRNQLITEYTDFVLETLSKIAKRDKNELRGADEFSISLIAFDEAIQAYSLDSKQTFKSFASLVIKRRLVDFWRKVETLDAEDFDGENAIDKSDENMSYSQYLLDQDEEERTEEIDEFSAVLNDFGMSFNDLVDNAPKHSDSKRNAIRIARFISEDDELLYYLYEKKKLPIKDLLDKLDVSKKAIERNRKFIIAMTIVIVENYVHLKEYLNV
ncbi:RNA polymerase sigma-I factor [Priestia filamentosa]|uniref:RNA polymerase sigma-I factor n=1 Tax=Priestia filamentosa TaxID=1402861 RepID=UPI00068EA0A8